jgi:hypothetical protein
VSILVFRFSFPLIRAAPNEGRYRISGEMAEIKKSVSFSYKMGMGEKDLTI